MFFRLSVSRSGAEKKMDGAFPVASWSIRLVHALDDLPKSLVIIGDIAGSTSDLEAFRHVILILWWEEGLPRQEWCKGFCLKFYLFFLHVGMPNIAGTIVSMW